MFEGAKITKQLIKELKKSEKDMNLYDILLSKNYYNPTEPEKFLDKLSKNYKFFNYFHQTKKVVLDMVLTKGNISIYFDSWNVDVMYNDNYMTFDRSSTTSDILEYISKLEYKELIKQRELKLSRIIS